MAKANEARAWERYVLRGIGNFLGTLVLRR